MVRAAPIGNQMRLRTKSSMTKKLDIQKTYLKRRADSYVSIQQLFQLNVTTHVVENSRLRLVQGEPQYKSIELLGT